MSVNIKDICVNDLIRWSSKTMDSYAYDSKLSDIKKLELSIASAILTASKGK